MCSISATSARPSAPSPCRRRGACLALTTICLVALAFAADAADATSPLAQDALSATVNPTTPKGAVLVVGGGGWSSLTEQEIMGVNGRSQIIDAARRITTYGWAVRTITYNGGQAGRTDVARAYAQLRDEVPRDKPVCVWGGSAGGWYGLMLKSRPSCIVTVSAPTDLPALSGHAPGPMVPRYDLSCQVAGDPLTGGWLDQGRSGDVVYQIAVQRLVGAARPDLSAVMRRLSPTSRAVSRLPRRMLIVQPAGDMLIPGDQQQLLADRVHAAVLASPAIAPLNAAATDLIPFGHTCITAGAMARYTTTERRFFRAVARASQRYQAAKRRIARRRS